MSSYTNSKKGEPVVRRMVAVGGSAKKMIHFHSFPKKDVSLLKKWLVAMKRDGFTLTLEDMRKTLSIVTFLAYVVANCVCCFSPAKTKYGSTAVKRTTAVVEENQPKIEDAHPSKKVALSPSKDSLKYIIEEQN